MAPRRSPVLGGRPVLAMTRAGDRTALVWPLLLVIGVTVVALGASPGRARAASPQAGICVNPAGCATSSTSPATSAATSGSTSSTSTTVAPTSTTAAGPPPTTPSSPYTATFVPCGADSGTCVGNPTQVQVRFPEGAPAAAVEVAWVDQGRPSSAPRPTSTSTVLAWSAGSDCGSGLRCWPWPAALTASSYVLNGSYRVTACGTDSGGACGSPASPDDIALAAPPGPPTGVSARSSGSQVAVTWKPPAAAPPDLTSYTVSRDGRDVYTCSTDGLGPGAPVACPSPLTLVDRPGDGSFAYAVRAYRLGPTAAADAVAGGEAPADAGGKVAVPGPVLTPPAGPAGGGVPPPFTPSPVIGSTRTIGGPAPLPDPGRDTAPPPNAAAGQGALPGVPGSPANLTYPPDEPVVGNSSRLAMRVRSPSPPPDVLPAGMLALGLLALAIAGHVLYLRAEVARVQADLARSGGAAAGPPPRHA